MDLCTDFCNRVQQEIQQEPYCGVKLKRNLLKVKVKAKADRIFGSMVKKRAAEPIGYYHTKVQSED